MPNYPQVQGHPHNEHHSDRGGERAAAIYTLVVTAQLNGLNPEAYLKDILSRIADGHPINRIAELLPWRMIAATAPLPA
jgi:hypothetical protein